MIMRLPHDRKSPIYGKLSPVPSGAFCCSRLSSPVEYSLEQSSSRTKPPASRAGVHARAAWHKPDGAVVYFLCFQEQLASVPDGVTVHFVGKASAEMRRYKFKLIKLAA